MRRLRRLTLRDRVTLVATTVLALALAVGGLVGNLAISYRFHSDIDGALRTRAAAQRIALNVNEAGLKVGDAPDDGVLDEQSWVFDRNGPVESPRASASINAAAVRLSRVSSATFSDAKREVRLLAVPVRADSGRQVGTIVVGLSREAYERTAELARIATLIVDLFALVAAALVVRWSVGRALRPVDEMTQRAAQWSEQDLDRRFEMGEPYDEITGLAATLDGLLGRIDTAMQSEKRLTAEIAHELRTPLAGIRAEAELAIRSGATGEKAPLEQIIASADRTNAAVETLLAAHSGGAIGDHWCQPADTLEELVAVSETAAKGRGVTLVLEIAEDIGRAGVDSDVLAQTLSPVLENAIRHARSRVTLRAEREGGATLIGICDDGDGLPADQVEGVFEPGSSTAGGAGLGLPLARRLAQTFKGTLLAVPSDRGACFELTIPNSRAR